MEIDKMRELVDWLNARTKEYDAGTPSVSDKDWDDKYFELVNLEKEYGQVLPDSPTAAISYSIVNELVKVEHNHLMLSADKTKSWSEFTNYFKGHSVIGMLKMDGLTCSLRYVNGRLVSAESRGNGVTGEDITHNAMVIKSIPKRINYTDELIIDGEVICTTKDFEPFKDDYANPRNFAAGSIRLLDSKECASRNLTFIAWNIVKGFDDDNSFLSKLEKISDLGFTVVPYTSSLEDDAKEFLIETANKLGYPIDGLVGRFDDITYGNSLGATDHHSKAIYAFKFYDEEYETTLKDITYDVSRTGQLTPVAIFEPVDTGDSVIERASLHNLSIMEDTLHIPFVGQHIKVFKANMIIPAISWAEEISEGGDIDIPSVCPICGGPTEVKESDAGVRILYCGNPECSGKLSTRIDHFFGIKGLNAKGISRATIEKLIDWGWVNELSDMFKLVNHKSEWIEKAGFGPASVNKVLDAIDLASRTCSLESVIAGIGIPLIGKTVAKVLAQKFKTYDAFKDAVDDKKFKFYDIGGFGIEMHNALKNFDYTELDNIVNNYLSIAEVKEDKPTSSAVKDMTFVITGKLSRKRDDIKADIEAAGGKVGSSVTGKTNYLVCNQPEDTTKYHAAEDKGIPIINEEKLMEMINNG